MNNDIALTVIVCAVTPSDTVKVMKERCDTPLWLGKS